MQSLIRSKSAGFTGGRGTAGAGPGRDLLYGEVGYWGCGLQDWGGVHPYSFGDDVLRLGGQGYESLLRLSLCEVGVDVVEDVGCVGV